MPKSSSAGVKRSLMSWTLMTFAIALFFSLEVQADQDEDKDEDDYVKEWCAANDGERYWPLDDKTEADCLTDTHVVELKRTGDWSNVLEGIGQVIHYTQQLGLDRQPGIVLIIEDKKGCRDLSRLRKTLKGVSVNGRTVELLPAIGPYAEQCPQ